MTDRAHLYRVITDTEGNVRSGASVTVTVYQPGTTTVIPDTIYADNTSGTTLANPFVTSTGAVDFYLATPRRVDINMNDGTRSAVYHDVDVLEVVAATPATSAPIGYEEFAFANTATMHDGDTATSPTATPSAAHGTPGWVYAGGVFTIDAGIYAISSVASVNPITQSTSAPRQPWRVHLSLGSIAADLVFPAAAFDPLGDVWFAETSSWYAVSAVSAPLTWTPQISVINAPTDLAVQIAMTLRVVRFAFPA